MPIFTKRMKMKDKELVSRAREFATKAHADIDQRRKYTDEPYIVHPAEVARIVSSVPHTPEMLAAAWLHDVVEDTPVTLEEIQQEFGKDVASLVEELTDVSRPEDGSRTKRKTKDRKHTAQASAEAQTVKLADLLSNTKDIVKFDKTFARTYLKEKLLLLEVMTKGDRRLHKLAFERAKEGLKSL